MNNPPNLEDFFYITLEAFEKGLLYKIQKLNLLIIAKYMLWNFNKNISNRIALIDTNSEHSLTYQEVEKASKTLIPHLKKGEKKLAFLLCDNSFKSILSYIALLKSGNATVLLDSKLDKTLLSNLISKYSPELIISPSEKKIKNYTTNIITENNIHINKRVVSIKGENIYSDLAVLLSTSGTTGSSKLVRLSYKNLQANAESIAEYLDITENERPITSLPMSYSYGLSVINSHLLKGAAIVLTNGSFVLRNFWNIFNKYQCTSFAGVPYSYQLLKKINFEKIDLPTLRTLTQAGGNLSESYQKYFAEIAEKRGIKFFVMYGQTEATARISYVPPDKLKIKYGSIGIPIPNGKLNLYSDNTLVTEHVTEGELVYSGNNVMLGYATDRSSLQKGDELNGVLHTGDLGRMDKDGYFYITGRVKRFIKIFGLRLNLDEVERMIENHLQLPTVCIGNDDQLRILVQTDKEDIIIEVKNRIKEMYKLHGSVIKVHIVTRIPVTSSGKKDYKTILKEWTLKKDEKQ